MAWPTRIQLCGRLAIERDGMRVETRLPGRQGVLMLGYLAANLDRWITRDEVADALWGDDPPPDADGALASLLSKVRRVVGPEHIAGRSSLRFVATDQTMVDVHFAIESLHRAQAHVASGRTDLAWQPAHGAFAIARRTFLLGHEAPWIDDWRRRLEEVELRGLECHAECSLAAGELAEVEQVARDLVSRSPYRESGHRLLMCALERAGNRAEALRVYERLRSLLDAELGTDPGPEVAAVHLRLLRAGR